VPPLCPDSDTTHFSPPANNPRRADLPSRLCQTTTGVTATRCRDRSAGNRLASEGHAANKYPHDYQVNDLSRTDREPIVHRDDRPTSKLQTGAADKAPSPPTAPALHNPRNTRVTLSQRGIVPAACVVGFAHRRLQSPATTPGAGCH